MADKKERRGRTRVPLTGLAVVTSGNNMHIASAMDVAAGGISVVVPEHVPEETEVSVEFGLPGVEERFLIKAVVARVAKKPDGFQLGMRFSGHEGRVLAHVQEFVRDQLVKLLRSRQQEAPRQNELVKQPPPRPCQQEKQPREAEDYRPTKMTIDLDSSERASEVARMFREAYKKKSDPKKES